MIVVSIEGVEKDGKMALGWLLIDNNWYYFKKERSAGYMVTDWRKIDGTWYYFKKKEEAKHGTDYGYMYKNKWLNYNRQWYYFEDSGAMVAGKIIEWEGNKYYLDGDGIMAENATVTYAGIKYTADGDGKCTVIDNDLNRVKSARSRKHIEKLHPDLKQYIIDFIIDAESIYSDIVITDSFRSIDEQNRLYDQGRTTPGNIVTNAKGGSSLHNYGLAIDIVRITNGTVNYDGTDYARLATVVSKYGLEWGGSWTKFKDRPHYQKTFGYTVNQLYQKYLNGDFIEGGIYVQL